MRYFVRRCWNEGRSKAALTALVGSDAALASERGHAVRLLIEAPARYLRQAIGGDRAGLARAAFCLVGLAVTGAGYLAGRARRVARVTGGGTPEPPHPADPPHPSSPARPGTSPADPRHPSSRARPGISPATSSFEPIPVLDLDLGTRAVPDHDRAGEVQLLVRDHGWPLGQVRVRLNAPPHGFDDWRTAVQDAAPELTPSARGRGASVPEVNETVTVVICTLGRNPLLTSTVEAVLGQRGAMDELLVVDNDPGSGRVAALLAGVDDPRVGVVPEPRRGASNARNAGATRATGVLLAFTDDDAVPDPDWTLQLTAALTAHPGIGCATGLVLPAGFESADQLRFEEYGGFAKGYATTHWDPADDRALASALSGLARTAGSPVDAIAGRRGAAFP